MFKWIFRVLAVIVLLVIVAAVVGYFMLDAIIKNQVETQSQAATGVNTTLDGVNLSPFSGRLELEQFRLANPEGFADTPLFSLDSSDVQLELGSLLSDEVVIPTLAIDGTQVLIAFNDGQLNTMVLMDQIEERGQGDDATTGDEPPTPDAEGETVGYLIEHLNITNTKVTGSLEIVPGQPPLNVDLALADIQLQNVRGVELADVLAFVVETILINATRETAQLSPDLDEFVAGVEEYADQTVNEVLEAGGRKIDEVVPGTGERLEELGRRELGEELDDLFGADREQADEPAQTQEQ